MFGFPLLLIPLAICNIIVFLMPGVSFAAPLFALPLISGAAWTVTLSDALVAFGLFLLLLEVLKGARVGGKYVTDHLLALLIFGGAAAEFVMLPQFANATFFLLTLMALVDFLSGLGLHARRPRRVREVVVNEPIHEPVVVRELQTNVFPVTTPVTDGPVPLHEERVIAVTPTRVEPIIDMHPVEMHPVEVTDQPMRPPVTPS